MGAARELEQGRRELEGRAGIARKIEGRQELEQGRRELEGRAGIGREIEPSRGLSRGKQRREVTEGTHGGGMDPRRGGDCDPRGSAHHHGDACSLAVPCISAHPRDPCGPARQRSPASSAPSRAPAFAGTQPRGPLPPCASSAISGLLARLQCLGNSSPISGLPFPFLCFVLVFTFPAP